MKPSRGERAPLRSSSMSLSCLGFRMSSLPPHTTRLSEAVKRSRIERRGWRIAHLAASHPSIFCLSASTTAVSLSMRETSPLPVSIDPAFKRWYQHTASKVHVKDYLHTARAKRNDETGRSATNVMQDFVCCTTRLLELERDGPPTIASPRVTCRSPLRPGCRQGPSRFA